MDQTVTRKHVVIYTDGVCTDNPGPGGWGCVLKFGEHRKEMNGFMPDTTKHRMELFASISALGALKEPCNVTLYSPSSYLVDAFQNQWIDMWRRTNWKGRDGKPVPDHDLWLILTAQTHRHQVQFVRVQGNITDEESSRCSQLARDAVAEWRLINSPHDEDGELIEPAGGKESSHSIK